MTKLERREFSLNRRKIVDSQKWHWFEQIKWSPHKYQSSAHASKARFRFTCAGRRGGKTAWASKEAGSYMIAGPFRIWLCGPDYDAVMMEFRDILQDMRHPANPHVITRLRDNRDSGKLSIVLSNGAEVEGKSLGQPEKSPPVGEEIDLLILCEGAKIRNFGGEGGIWETDLKGNLGTRLGDVIGPTTPAGKDNWWYPNFTKGLSRTDPDYFSLQWPSWANPTFLEDPKKLRASMSRRAFEEQHLGLFVSWSGAIWIEDCGYDEKRHIVAPFKYPSWWRRIEVLDPGFSDYLAWLAAVIDPDGNVYIVDEFKCKRESHKQVVRRIINHRKVVYSDSGIPKGIITYVDPEDPSCAFHLMEAANELREIENDDDYQMICTSANNNVSAGFDVGAVYFANDKLHIFSPLQNVRDALGNHEWSDTLNSKGRHIERRDEYKHFSDLVRYLMLSNLRSSTLPKRTIVGRFGMRDLLGDVKSERSLRGLGFEQFKRLHTTNLN